MELQTTESPKLIRPFDVAYRLNYPVAKIIRWGRDGKIPGAVQIDEKHLRFDAAAVQRFIENGGNRALETATLTKKAPSVVTPKRKEPGKALRFDRKVSGPLARYQKPRSRRTAQIITGIPPELKKDGNQVKAVSIAVMDVGESFDQDFYPKHPTGNWKSIADGKDRPDRSVDPEELIAGCDTEPFTNTNRAWIETDQVGTMAIVVSNYQNDIDPILNRKLQATE
jgi:hypothetical protein